MTDNNYDYPVSIEEFAAYLDGNLSDDEMQRMSSIIEENDVMKDLTNCAEISDSTLEEQSVYEIEIPDDISNSDFELPEIGLSSLHINDGTDSIPEPSPEDIEVAALYENDFEEGYDIKNSKNITMTKINGEPMPWPGATTNEIQQQFVDTCAVKSQQIVMKTYGVDIPEIDLVIESAHKGYYVPGGGSDPNHVGKLLNDHGISTHSEENANVYDLVNELAQGHKVIVGVDADELWRPTWYNDIFGEEANHALVVTGIDTTDPENVKVIITDPGTGDVAKEYSLEQFLDAWHDSNCFYVATDNPAPANNPEMSGFDYELGHIPFICNIPYDNYELLVENFGIFHDDIIKNMNECIDNINNGQNMDFNKYDFQSAYDHLHNIEQLMQESWNDNMQNHMTEICESLIKDYWDWNSWESTLSGDIDMSGFVF